MSGAVAKMHCRIEFMKHVLPILFRPVAQYPYPLPVGISETDFLAILSLSRPVLPPKPPPSCIKDPCLDDFKDDTSFVLVGSADFSSSNLCLMPVLLISWFVL